TARFGNRRRDRGAELAHRPAGHEEARHRRDQDRLRERLDLAATRRSHRDGRWRPPGMNGPLRLRTSRKVTIHRHFAEGGQGSNVLKKRTTAREVPPRWSGSLFLFHRERSKGAKIGRHAPSAKLAAFASNP